MTGKRWVRIKEVFEAAVLLAIDRRESFVRAAFPDEPELAGEVLRLLAAGDRSDDYLERPPDPFRDLDRTATMPGATIGHYQLVGKIGEGGMGQVFQARDPRLGRFVAIKIISAKRENAAEQTVRLLREARAASALNHPNIVTVYDIGTVPGSNLEAPYVVMEFVEGRTLRELIAEGRLTLREELDYAVQIASALSAAHAGGIIHRDIKPANVMVNTRDIVKVLDFGLARTVVRNTTTPEEGDTLSQQLTRPGFAVGTPAYASPEQVEGRALDARTDVFSFGALLYELLTGARAFEGSTPIMLAAAVLRHEPPPVSQLRPELPAELDAIVGRCMRKRPEERFPNFADVRADLERLRQTLTATAGPPASAPAASKRFVLVAAVSVALLTIGGYWLMPRQASAPTAWTAEPLTSYVGVERSPSFSADGSQIAFSWNGEDRLNTDIYVRSTRGGRYLRLTEHPHSDETPAWSPDGQYIAFRRAEPGFGVIRRSKASLILIPPLGGVERVLAEGDIRSVAWTADSKEVAFSVQVARPEEGPGALRYAVDLITVATGARRRLVEPPSDTRGDQGISFSPDGKWAALARWLLAPSTDILVVPVAGGQPRTLTRENSWTNGLAWTPDSSEVVVSSTRDGRRRLWRIAATGRGEATPRALLGIEADAIAPAVFVGRGGLPGALAFERHNDDVNIWRFDLGRGNRTSARRLIDSTWRESSPALSADGARLAFVSTRSGVGEIFTSTAQGTNQGGIARLPGSVGSPRWSLDGSRLVFDCIDGANKDLYIVGSAGQDPVRLTSGPAEEARPSWSPDGGWIYFRSNRSGSPQIWRMPAEKDSEGRAEQLTRNGGAEPLASYDGRWVFYIRARRVPELWKMPAAGGEETKLIDGPTYGYWSVARDGIYYLDQFAREDGSRSLRFHDLRTGQTRPAAEIGGEIAPSLPGLSVSADGRVVALVQVERTEADLFLIPGFH